MTSLSLSDKGVSQEIPQPYLALLLYTPSSQGSRLLSELSDLTGNIVALYGKELASKRACLREEESVVQFIQLRESYIYCIIILDFYHLKLLYIKLLTLFIQRKIYFILKEEKESSSLFGL